MSQPSVPRTFCPRLEALEPRETPSAITINQPFDTVAPGAIPAGWAEWSNDESPGFGASAVRSLSPSMSLSDDGRSTHAGRAWFDQALPADQTVTASVLLDSLLPVQLIARGSNLDSRTPTAYTVTITRGLVLELHALGNGVATPLATLHSALYFSGKWVRVTLSATGDRLQVWVQRGDTSQWLSAQGTWQADRSAAIDLLDRTIVNGGRAGIGRAARYAGPVYLDDFSVTAQSQETQAPTIPQIPRHFSHIRIAELAYTGNPMGTVEDQLVRSAVDLIVPATRYLAHIDQISPGTPQLIYTNVSNLYLEVLTDWLNYADRIGVSREVAFYHVTQATPFSGSSPSSQPVNWFWNVARGPVSGAGSFVNLTSQARSTTADDTLFGAAGQALFVGYPERFRELNLSLSRVAGAGWSGVLEYASAVDAAGNPTGWKPLPLISDGTSGFQASGRIVFDPPADWKAALVPGHSARLFYVRVRTTAGTASAAPSATNILGRDYVGAGGKITGTIPAFDTAADRNGDGYLNDAEYAQGRTGFDARFAYESRLFYPYYGQMRFVTNPSNPAVQGWAADYDQRILAASPLADGLFMDNSGGKLPFAGTAVAEPTGTYATDYAALLAAVNRRIAPRWLLANTAGGSADTDHVIQAVPATFEEFALRPLTANWAQFLDISNRVSHRQSLTSPAPYLILDSLPSGGSPTDPRTQLATLAYYYLVGNPDTTFLMFFGGFEPATTWSRHWVPAATYNVGAPLGAWSVFASGQDPTNTALAYKVYQRAYQNALVLYKPLSYTLGKGTGTTANTTATLHRLNGNYRALNADGTLGPIINQIMLRNGEGAILIKA
jgi:hypothetical protein